MKVLHNFFFTLILAGVLSVSWSADCEGVPCDVVCELGGKELFPDCACDCPRIEKRGSAAKIAKAFWAIFKKIAPPIIEKQLEN
ncbi:hypothetical protein TNCT_576521 [Trichonephila clavata]|uniref:Uncharacterized protein n=1 Tax=Trichonephila clavata TaxID=2740835 RepID=A0A8X6K973_TRICU|nr:hypothetical protein TNCT_576521 [Trichonephila clavata]